MSRSLDGEDEKSRDRIKQRLINLTEAKDAKSSLYVLFNGHSPTQSFGGVAHPPSSPSDRHCELPSNSSRFDEHFKAFLVNEKGVP